MLGKPDCGWSKVTIGSFHEYASYLTNVPFDCMNACIRRIKDNAPLEMTFDAEGPGLFFVSADSKHTVITWDEDPEGTVCIPDVNDVQLIGEIIHDIDRYQVKWRDEWDGVPLKELRQKLAELKALAADWEPLKNAAISKNK